MKSLQDWPLTCGEPNWAPLESVLSSGECEDYMYMGQAGPIVLYKHRWSRALSQHWAGREDLLSLLLSRL